MSFVNTFTDHVAGPEVNLILNVCSSTVDVKVFTSSLPLGDNYLGRS